MKTSSTLLFLLFTPTMALRYGGTTTAVLSSARLSGQGAGLGVPPRIGGPSFSAALAVRGGADAKVLSTNRSLLGTLILFVRAFFASLLDPTYGISPASKAGGGGAAAAADADPFAKRAKAGLGRTSKMINVDELEKMG
jgi:hypothetical protein